MLVNNNLNICGRLVRRDFRFHRVKNLILILACALVTGLYSFVFLLAGSIEGAYLLNYQYTYGSTSHILYTGLTEHQADILSRDAAIRSSVRLSSVGQLTDAVIGQRQVKLAVTDRDYAETVLSIPTSGRLPEQKGEIALDEFTMDSLGILREEGAPVELSWTDPEGISHTSSFTLCGWWASPTNFSEACAWITEETARDLYPEYDAETARNTTLGVTLYQPRNLEAQAEQLLASQGIAGAGCTTNLAFNSARMEQAQSNAMPYYYPAILVLICGFLMIYGIVHIASGQDGLFFAEVKALGMTPRQIRVFLAEKACAVSLLGVLPGFLIGFLLHLAVTSRIVSGMEENPAFYFLSWGPFFAGAALSLGTTLLSYLLPARRLSRMTPAGLLRSLDKTPVPGRKSASGSGRIRLPGLAFRALLRDRFKMLLSAVTLLLALFLLTSVWIQYISLKEDLYLEAMSPWDYTIADGSAYLSVQQYNQNNHSITDETIEELRSRPEVLHVSALKTRELSLTASEELRQRLISYYNASEEEGGPARREMMERQPLWIEGLERLEETGEYMGVAVSLEGEYLDYILENVSFTSGSFDADAFASGNVVLTAGANAAGLSSEAAGETVTLAGETFEVLGSIADSGMILSGSNSPEASFCIYYYMAPAAFDRLFPDQGVRQAAVSIDHDRQEAFEAYLDAYEQGLNRGVGITRRSEYQENFAAGRLNTVLPTLIVSVALLGIALLNFTNMLIIKAVNRRREFAVYESLGMTHSQLQTLLLLEGVFHAALMFLATGPLTFLFARFVMPSVIEGIGSWCMVYTFSVTPLALTLAGVLVLSAAVPLGCLHFISRGSITERLRTAE